MGIVSNWEGVIGVGERGCGRCWEWLAVGGMGVVFSGHALVWARVFSAIFRYTTWESGRFAAPGETPGVPKVGSWEETATPYTAADANQPDSV
jgi:hypothetical protein